MDKNIFESWAKFSGGEIRGRAKEGFLLINKETLNFKSYEEGIFQEILLSDISEVVKEKKYLKIITAAGKIYTLWTLDPGRVGSFTGEKKSDDNKTRKLYSLLISLKGSKGLIEQNIIEKVKNMMEVSTRINIDMLKEVLGVESSIFYQNIFNIAAKLDLTIDGNQLNIENVSFSDFIRALNEYLNLGISNDILIDEKLSCPYCGFSLKPHMKFCTQCGTALIKDENEEKHE